MVLGMCSISQVQRSDSGTYECIASNEKYRVSAYATLTVEYAPVIVNSPENVDIPAGYDAQFQCNVSGQPNPTVSWQHNDENLNRVLLRYRVREVGGVHTLTTNSVMNADNGQYTCSVTNTYGTVRSSAELTDQAPNLLKL
ncbi:protein sax-3-like [Corticium candelabrum]|uniref:protein sax-3-like n=1 Tax=Corticium candelabrum TaxID=121492 RepID=UPI002E273762|nr:protein sax-3-like [Corticium candelabrum]